MATSSLSELSKMSRMENLEGKSNFLVLMIDLILKKIKQT